MLALFFVVLIDLVGFGIVIPLIPFYAEFYRASPDQVTLVMSTYSLAQLIAAPFWGRLSDRIGRRPVLLLTLAGTAVGYVWLGFAHTLWMLFVVRAFGGFMAGNISTAFAYAADVTTPENRAKGMGVIGAAFGLGFILGPAIGGILAGADPAHPNFLAPALTAAGMSAAALLFALFTLKESLAPEVRQSLAARPRRNRWAHLAELLTRHDVGIAIGLAFLATFVFAGMESTFAMWSRRVYGWGAQQNGYLFAFVGVIGTLIQGGAVGRLAKKWGERVLVLQGSASLAIGMALVPFSTSLPLLIVAMIFMAYGFSLLNPALNSLISRGVGREDQGSTMGVTRSATTLSRVVGQAWAGVLFAYLGRNWPYYAGAVIMVVVLLIALRGLPAAQAEPQPSAESH